MHAAILHSCLSIYQLALVRTLYFSVRNLDAWALDLLPTAGLMTRALTVLGRHMVVSDELTMTANWNHLATVERAEKLPGDPWDGTWFEEDYCEGPGQALIVNPRGEVKPCCGFASDLDQLTSCQPVTTASETLK